MFIIRGIIVPKSNCGWETTVKIKSCSTWNRDKIICLTGSVLVNVSKQVRKNTGQEEFEDNKGIIRIRISKDRQRNGQRKKYKWTNNDLHNITHKTKDRVARTTLNTGDENRCSGRISRSYSASCTRQFFFFSFFFTMW